MNRFPRPARHPLAPYPIARYPVALALAGFVTTAMLAWIDAGVAIA